MGEQDKTLPLWAALLALLVIICLLLAAWCLGPGFTAAVGGAQARPAARRAAPSPHIVVDTLNLTHWLWASKGAAALSPALIVETIDATAPILKLRYPGQVVYVLKDRESQFNLDTVRSLYQETARRNGVYLAIAERYADPPAASVMSSEEHSGRGRDDFYMSILAGRYKCAVLTADRLRDFGRFRSTIPPFQVYEYNFWRDLPSRDFIRPDAAAYARVRKPRTIHPRDVFGAKGAFSTKRPE